MRRDRGDTWEGRDEKTGHGTDRQVDRALRQEGPMCREEPQLGAELWLGGHQAVGNIGTTGLLSTLCANPLLEPGVERVQYLWGLGTLPS